MFILYFDGDHHERYHGLYYLNWPGYGLWRAGEGAWLVPGTDSDDCFYGLGFE